MTQHTVTTSRRPTCERVLVDGRPVGLVGRTHAEGSSANAVSWYAVGIDGTRRGGVDDSVSHDRAVAWVARHYLDRTAE